MHKCTILFRFTLGLDSRHPTTSVSQESIVRPGNKLHTGTKVIFGNGLLEAEILDTAEAYNRVIALAMVFRGMTMVLTAIYRGYGDSKTPMVANSLVNIINVMGNYLLIFPTRQISVFGFDFTMIGAGWGVVGAAVATTFSTIVGALLLLVICFTRKSEMQISLKDNFKLDFEELKTVFTISSADFSLYISIISYATSSTV